MISIDAVCSHRICRLSFLARAASPCARTLEKLVTVTGEATVAVAPDAAMIRIGVSSQDKTAREASDANAKQMTAVLAAIKGNNIAERDIQTSRLSLQPQYDPNKSGTARLTGFQATNQVTVRIRDIGKSGRRSSTAPSSPAPMKCRESSLSSPSSRSCSISARDDAIADAHRKAELYAKAAGVKARPCRRRFRKKARAPPPRPMQALRAGAVPRSLRASRR